MATISLNTADAIEFKNILPARPTKDDTPTVLAQVGEWEIGTAVETGILIDAYGPEDRPPILTANDARKLAKWLNRAADRLDEAQAQPKKKKRQHYRDDEDDDEVAQYY